MIYADNAATTALDPEAFEAMRPFLTTEYGNASQPYAFARPVKRALRQARETIAACINALPEEIYFTSGGTESDNWAVKGLMRPDDQRLTLTSEIEHHAVLHACRAVERMGFPVQYLRVDQQGIVQPETLKNSITDRTKLVSVMLANNEIGTIEPVSELAEIAHAHGALFHTDAVQAVGHIPVDVQALGADMLSASAHKFNGPKGVGFLYVRKGTDLYPYADGGAQESGMRAGTENAAGIAGMAAALQKNCRMMRENDLHMRKLEQDFLDVLNSAGIDYVRNGTPEHLPGNVNISIRGASGEMLLHRLDLKGICISTGSACDSVNTQVSHVIRAIGVSKEYAEGTIRITFGTGNQAKDGQTVAEAIVKILKK